MISRYKLKKLADSLKMTDSFVSKLVKEDFKPDELIELKEQLAELTGKCFRVNALNDGSFRGRLWFATTKAMEEFDSSISFVPENELCELKAFNAFEKYDSVISALRDSGRYVCRSMPLKFCGDDDLDGYGGTEMMRLSKLLSLETGRVCHIFTFGETAIIRLYEELYFTKSKNKSNLRPLKDWLDVEFKITDGHEINPKYFEKNYFDD